MFVDFHDQIKIVLNKKISDLLAVPYRYSQENKKLHNLWDKMLLIHIK